MLQFEPFQNSISVRRYGVVLYGPELYEPTDQTAVDDKADSALSLLSKLPWLALGVIVQLPVWAKAGGLTTASESSAAHVAAS